ncbi:MAG: glycosyltransferase family 2 protein [Patescibacteria group bacterium]|nr:glycosyltransferase family 2 protein [Patescibacteria group bacterium]
MLSPELYYLKIGKADELSNRTEKTIFRFFEIFPGLLSWITLILVFIVAWRLPVVAAIFIIVFDVFWLIKTIYFSIHAFYSFKILRKNLAKNWLVELKNLPKENYQLNISDWREIYHLVILPMVSESYEIISSTLNALSNVNYPTDRLIVVLATEERVQEQIQETITKVKEQFGNVFKYFLITVHPKDIEGEIAGKGANATWAAREAKKNIIDPLHIPYENILVSNFDIDTVIPADYFGCLTYHFLTANKPLNSSYQPVPLFTNNIWEAPALARVISFSATFFQLIQQARPERMTTFSSHSMPFKALVDIDFWQTNVVSEDSRIFWQCFLYYDGNWEIVPLFYPVSMDANVDAKFIKTMINQYKQQRRWAYGVFDIAYAFFGFLKNKKIPLKKKLTYGFFLFDGFYSWATTSLIIFFLGWLPLVLGGPKFNFTILSFYLPKMTSYILTVANIGIITCAILNFWFLPPRPPYYGKWRYVYFVLQWFLTPINLIFFGSIPALDAQTRLMIKKYMGFWVTPKHRKLKIN